MVTFSIITCTLNSAKTLERTLQSVQNQELQCSEHIIIDGNSTDETKFIIQRYKESSHYPVKIKHLPPNGVYNAFNVGLQEACGDVFVFLNADDWIIEPVYLKTLQKYFIRGVSIVYSDLVIVGSTQKVKRKWVAGICSEFYCKFGVLPPHPTFVCKKHVYDEIGMFNEVFKISADIDFMIRAFQHGQFKIEYIKEVFVGMQLGGVSNQGIKTFFAKIREDYTAFKNNNLNGLVGVICKRFIKLRQLLIFKGYLLK